jgi:hypothetical protein
MSLLFCSALPTLAQNAAVDRDAPTHDCKSAAEIDREWQVSVAKYDGGRTAIPRQVDLQGRGQGTADRECGTDRLEREA